DDNSLPAEYRRRYIGSRRSRQLRQEYSAFVGEDDFQTDGDLRQLSKLEFARLCRSTFIRYDQAGRPQEHGVPIWHFSAIRRGAEILAYRRGRYLDGRQITGQ